MFMSNSKLSAYVNEIDVPTTTKEAYSFTYLYAAHGMFGGNTREQRRHNQESSTGKQKAKDTWVDLQTKVADEIRTTVKRKG
jgi:hypothetical protein